MNKTKLGVSTNLMAAFIYALAIVISFVSSGMAFTLALVVTVAYILYKEEDMWLKSSAVKAVAIVLVFMLVPFLFGFVYDIMDFLNGYCSSCPDRSSCDHGWYHRESYNQSFEAEKRCSACGGIGRR